jgi:hypothetical protein
MGQSELFRMLGKCPHKSSIGAVGGEFFLKFSNGPLFPLGALFKIDHEG